MLDEVLGQRLLSVERFAWKSGDGSPVTPDVGSVHLWFDDGCGVHFDGSGDWTLRWSVSEPGDDLWMHPYLYDCEGRWVLRESTGEEPFRRLVGLPLTSAVPLVNGCVYASDSWQSCIGSPTYSANACSA